ncbi:cutinase family protein [Actinomycetospora lutea]|uniref:cutinase family protein n=1 Tax=Actinomycetospora lutea TaxID=663604 RepID=UPI002366AD63|nr:cutinase family protein [Actinomycetospora lutea]MDD7942885.1 cutinase family protein [Actinomycetospora lutea]
MDRLDQFLPSQKWTWNGLSRNAIAGVLSVAAATVLASSLVATDASLTSDPCPRYLVYGVRGSWPDTPGFGGVGDVFLAEFKDLVGAHNVQPLASEYPGSWDFENSIKEGQKLLEEDLAEAVPGQCLDTRQTEVVLVGYSAGAAVIHRSFAELAKYPVEGIALFGDPDFCYDDDVTEREAALSLASGPFNPTQRGTLRSGCETRGDPPFEADVISSCIGGDWTTCDGLSSFNFSQRAAHWEYVKQGYAKAAARKMALLLGHYHDHPVAHLECTENKLIVRDPYIPPGKSISLIAYGTNPDGSTSASTIATITWPPSGLPLPIPPGTTVVRALDGKNEFVDEIAVNLHGCAMTWEEFGAQLPAVPVSPESSEPGRSSSESSSRSTPERESSESNSEVTAPDEGESRESGPEESAPQESVPEEGAPEDSPGADEYGNTGGL